MTTRINALADRISNQAFGLTNYGNLEADVNYFFIAGAAIAAVGGANTVTITSRYHRVTIGGGGTIDNISDLLGAVDGQIVEFYFVNSQTIRNNGGGAGNIRTVSGGDRLVTVNEIVAFRYDAGSGVWRESQPRPPIWTISATPPTNPANGDIWVFPADDTNGVYWQFIYDTAETTYKWRYLGGPPMWSEVLTAEATTQNAYSALTTAGPSIALVRGGDYMVEHGFDLSASGAQTASYAMSYDIGVTGAVDADWAVASPAGANPAASVMRKRRKTAFAASTTLTAKYKNAFGNSVTGTFEKRWMAVTPIRVI